MPVHRDILPALCLARLSPSEVKVALAILRASWGWSETTTRHRLSQTMVERLTGIRDRRQMRAAFAGLRLKGVAELVSEHDAKSNTPAEWAIVKDYDAWACLDAVVPWRQAGTEPPGHSTPEGVDPPGVSTSEPPGVSTSEPSGAQTPGHEAQVEAQLEAQVLLTNPEPVKADPVLTVWAGYTACRENQRKAPGKTARTVIKARLKDGYSVEALIAVAEWVMLSPDGWAPLLRESQSTGYETIYKPTKMDGRIDQAMAWRSNGSVKAPAGQVPGLTDEQRIAAQRRFAWQRDELVARMEAAPDIAAIPEITLPRLDSLLGTLVRAEPVPEWLRVKWVIGMDRRRVELQERLR